MPAIKHNTLASSMKLITLGGCLAMVYTICISCPVIIEFFRELGASEFHIGILGGLPMIMLFMQFVGAFITNHVRHRKAVFIVLAITSRLIYLPIAFAPLIFPDLSENRMMILIILLIGFNALLANLMIPLWFSWMGDLIPRRILNRYWGRRHQFMTLTWTNAFLLISLFTYLCVEMPVVLIFQVLVVVGCLAGVVVYPDAR